MKNLFHREGFSILVFGLNAIVAAVAVCSGEKTLALCGIANMLFWAADTLHWVNGE
ncbi:MAG: hypothetical protein LUB59_03660 [Candidatus Gastranaerophilales bacterium]|nr:hypothetical protein [Candidatus Gastranaerophilales bacterium]